MEEYTMSCFLSGLKNEIQYPVMMFTSKYLQQVISLAKLQELMVENLQQKQKKKEGREEMMQKSISSASLLPTSKF